MNGFKELDAYFQLPKKNIGSGLVAKVMSNSCNHRDCSLPGSSVYVTSQARILEWVAISFSRGYSWSRDWMQISCVSCIAGNFLLAEPYRNLNMMYKN